jgi:hypothetical protein
MNKFTRRAAELSKKLEKARVRDLARNKKSLDLDLKWEARQKGRTGRLCSYCEKYGIYDATHDKRACYLAKLDTFIERVSGESYK